LCLGMPSQGRIGPQYKLKKSPDNVKTNFSHHNPAPPEAESQPKVDSPKAPLEDHSVHTRRPPRWTPEPRQTPLSASRLQPVNQINCHGSSVIRTHGYSSSILEALASSCKNPAGGRRVISCSAEEGSQEQGNPYLERPFGSLAGWLAPLDR